METDIIFPTVVGRWHGVFSDEENNIIVDRCYDVYNNIPMSNVSWLSSSDSPYNTVKTYNIVSDPKMNFFISKIDECVHEYAATVYNDPDRYVCGNAWMNLYKEGNYQEPHIHSNFTYSVIYFPLAPQNSGQLVFQSPVPNQISSENITSTNVANSINWIYNPNPNMLLVFKSNLSHFVLPVHNSDDRISIALNYALNEEDYSYRYINVKD